MGKGQLLVKSGISINKCGRKGGYRITIRKTPLIAADEDPPREAKTGG